MSDQDFFFDEEDEPVKSAPSPRSKSTARTEPARSGAPRPRQSAPSSSAGFFDQSVSMAVAALMTAIGLLVGVIAGFLIAPGGSARNTGSPVTGLEQAPALSGDQLQSGELPAGHPDISGMATAPGSAETTSK